MSDKGKLVGGWLFALSMSGLTTSVVMKLTGYSDWPWVWVLSPIWLPLAAITAIIVAVFMVYMSVTLSIILLEKVGILR